MRVGKKKESALRAIKSIADRGLNPPETFIALTADGELSVEDFKEISEFDSGKIVLNAGGKRVYIYGNKLKVLSYNKYDINISGKITKIEIFEVD